LLLRRPRTPPLFPYTTLFRSLKQQMDKPQAVYEEPANLFVAKFLGNPPINTYEAKIKNGQLMIHDGSVVERGFDVEDQDVIMGRSEEHTSELQSRENLVCRLL